MTNSRQSTAEAICRDVYRETYAEWLSQREISPIWHNGYAILGAPPTFESPLAIIGVNPGGEANQQEIARGSWTENVQVFWPSQSYLATNRSDALPKAVQSLFGDADRMDALDRAVNFNLNFFRTADVNELKKLPPPIRKRLEDFSNRQTRRLLTAIAPRAILFLGTGTASPDSSQFEWPLKLGRRWTFGTGRAYDRPAMAILHPTGARVSREERSVTVERLRHFLNDAVPPGQ